jgi:hypothetical protein
VLGLGGAPIFAYALWREGEHSRLGALAWAHVFLFGSYIWLVSAIVAFRRMLQKKAGWVKTSRTPMVAVGADAESSGEDVGRMRYLANERGVTWRGDSPELLPLRPQNFLPRFSEDRADGRPVYGTSAGPPGGVSDCVTLARGEAHLRRLAQILELAGVGPAEGRAAIRTRATTEIDLIATPTAVRLH